MLKQIIILFILGNIYTSFMHAQNAQQVETITTNDSLLNKSSGLYVADDDVTKYYKEGDYNKVIANLEARKAEQKKNGLESSSLYYNLGNAYFRNNDIAKAILNYERAALIDPGDRDIRHNIQYANTKIEDKILKLDTFFLSSWFTSLQNIFSSNAWARIAIISFLLFICGLFIFFYSRSIWIKKMAFYINIIWVVFTILSNIFSYKQKHKIEHHNSAIIMAGSAPINSSPDRNSKELFILHSGTKVVITKEDRNWVEIEIADGNIGWIEKDNLEII